VIPLGSVVLRKVPLAAPPALNILLFGRLEPYKGVGVLVEAMKTVWESHPEATLTVAGRGPAAAEVPTDARVNLMDHYIPEAEIESLFASASVCVLPYTEASQSGVGLQSLSMGVPTVVTDVGALPELAENESRLVPPSEPKILGEAIVTALASGLAERESTLEFARERFSWETVAKQYEDLFRSIARNRPIG
jgi:glycosyltransferase involved in cell wall biosynthesis